MRFVPLSCSRYTSVDSLQPVLCCRFGFYLPLLPWPLILSSLTFLLSTYSPPSDFRNTKLSLVSFPCMDEPASETTWVHLGYNGYTLDPSFGRLQARNSYKQCFVASLRFIVLSPSRPPHPISLSPLLSALSTSFPSSNGPSTGRI